MLRPYRHLSEKRQINVKATKIPNMWGVGPFDVHKVLLHTNWYLEPPDVNTRSPTPWYLHGGDTSVPVGRLKLRPRGAE